MNTLAPSFRRRADLDEPGKIGFMITHRSCSKATRACHYDVQELNKNIKIEVVTLTESTLVGLTSNSHVATPD